MVEAFDRIVIEVPDVDEAAGQLGLLLGTEAVTDTQGSTLLLLGNTSLELRPGAGDAACISGLVLRGDRDSVDGSIPDSLAVTSGTLTDDLRDGGAKGSDLWVDHIVLQTRSAEDCIALYRDRLGVRLALDRDVPDWGGRMLFFRAGKMTLEVIANPEKGPLNPVFWGIAFQCPDIEQAHARLMEAGVTLSEVRDGRKPGTRVATIKSHCLGLPTLLIEPAPR